jgi:hypothetical protein
VHPNEMFRGWPPGNLNDSFGKKNNSAETTKMNEEYVRSYKARGDSSMCQTGVKKFLF